MHTFLILLAIDTTVACPEQDLLYGQNLEFMRILELYNQNIDCYPQINLKFPTSNKLPNLFLSISSFIGGKN